MSIPKTLNINLKNTEKKTLEKNMIWRQKLWRGQTWDHDKIWDQAKIREQAKNWSQAKFGARPILRPGQARPDQVLDYAICSLSTFSEKGKKF